jgi:hypothetical protein
MSWQDAHRYYRALRAIEAELNWSADGEVIWRPEYADIFGSPERLLLALRSRWETLVRAQADDAVTADRAPSDVVSALAAAHPGLIRALARANTLKRNAALLVAGAA